MANPITATHGTPGSGKSFFLDTIGKLNEEDLQNMCTNNEMREILKSSVAVSVTFNSTTVFNEQIDGVNAETGLAIRILYSFYFTQSNNSSWRELAALLKNLILKEALDCILFAIKKQDPSKQGVLLLVDELLKSSTSKYPENIDQVLRSIGEQLDTRSSEQFNILVSTLDINPLARLSLSGRPIIWVVLNSLTFSKLKALFSGLEPQGNKNALYQCISDCNGHPRSLETLKLLCDQDNWKLPTYPFLMENLRQFLRGKTILIPASPHVLAALRGEEVELDDPVPGWSGTFRTAITHGYFLNSIEGMERQVIPKLSPLLLMCFANQSRNEPIANCINDMLYLEANFSWKCYESFHAKWEVLRRLIAKPTERVSLVDYSLSESASLPNFPLTRKKVLALKHHFPGHQMEAPLEELLESIIIPGDSNPGYDIVSFESGKVIAIECRYSIPCTTTTLGLQEIKSKWNLTEKSFAAHLEKLELSKKDLFLVVCAWRKLATDVTKERLPANCIVLGKSELTKLYSPTLSSRPQFILESTLEGLEKKEEEVSPQPFMNKQKPRRKSLKQEEE